MMTNPLAAAPVAVQEVDAAGAADVRAVLGADVEQAEVERLLAAHGGLLAVLDGGPVGALLLEPEGDSLLVQRLAVRPDGAVTIDLAGRSVGSVGMPGSVESAEADAVAIGVVGALVGAAERVAATRGYDELRVVLPAAADRASFSDVPQAWENLGYRRVGSGSRGPVVILAKPLPVELVATSAEDARELGARVAAALRPGDLLILTGDLGAGKTTFAQGIGTGLDVRGDVTSPTFVIARVHPSLVGGPPLVHVDAYRLGGIEELDDLDLDAALEESVTVVEWGEGLAEGLSADRLEITLSRARGDDPSATEETDEPRGLTLPAVPGPGEPEEPDPRRVRVAPVGHRWIGSHLRRTLT